MSVGGNLTILTLSLRVSSKTIQSSRDSARLHFALGNIRIEIFGYQFQLSEISDPRDFPGSPRGSLRTGSRGRGGEIRPPPLERSRVATAAANMSLAPFYPRALISSRRVGFLIKGTCTFTRGWYGVSEVPRYSEVSPEEISPATSSKAASRHSQPSEKLSARVPRNLYTSTRETAKVPSFLWSSELSQRTVKVAETPLCKRERDARNFTISSL